MWQITLGNRKVPCRCDHHHLTTAKINYYCRLTKLSQYLFLHTIRQIFESFVNEETEVPQEHFVEKFREQSDLESLFLQIQQGNSGKLKIHDLSKTKRRRPFDQNKLKIMVK